MVDNPPVFRIQLVVTVSVANNFRQEEFSMPSHYTDENNFAFENNLAFYRYVLYHHWLLPIYKTLAILGVIFFLITVFTPKKDNNPFKRQELTTEYAFEGYAENLRQMAAMKEKCGHLFEPVQWVGCTNLPPSWQDTRNLDHLTMVSSSLGVWLNEVSPIVDAECEDEAPCRQWLEEKKRKESEPLLNVMFEGVEMLP